MHSSPSLIVFAGPNGAGKTTGAAALLPELGIDEYINPDVDAEALRRESPELPEAGGQGRDVSKVEDEQAWQQVRRATQEGRGDG